MFSSIWQRHQVVKDHSKITKIHFWMIQSAKKEVFGHFLEFVLLDRLDIAYCDRTKCFPAFGNVTRSWRSIQKSQKSIFDWSKVPKKRFLAIFRSWVCWIDLILQIVIELNVLWHLATSPGREGPFKNHKNPQFWMIQSAKKEVFSHFLTFGLLGRLDIVWCDTVSNIWKLY